MFLSRSDRDLGVSFQTQPGSQASSRVEAKNSALLSCHDGYLLEPPEWSKRSQASCGFLRKHSGWLSRPGRKQKSSSLDYGGVSGFFSSGGPSLGFLTRNDGRLSGPLVWRQGSRVSIRGARGSTSLLSSHGRVIGSRDALKKESRGLSGCGRNRWVPSTCAVDLRELLRVPLRSEGYCGVGRGFSGLH